MQLEHLNIFDVVTDSSDLASELRKCSDLMIVIRGLINAKKWSNKVAAMKLGLNQRQIKELKKGHLEEFSFDNLVDYLKMIERM